MVYTMMDYIKRCLNFSDNLVEELKEAGFFTHAEVITVERGSHILREGQQPGNTCLLIEGVVRGYLYDEKGREVTSSLIYRPGMAVMPGPDFGESALINLQALTKVSILRLPLMRFDDMLGYSPEIVRTGVEIFQLHFRDTWNLKMVRYRYKAMERYEWFVREHGELLGRISNKYIASYLGMTPSTLSRTQKMFRLANRE